MNLILLIATLVALLCGPLLYAILKTRPRLTRYMDGFVLVSVTGLVLHPWQRDRDVPFRIDSHDVPGNPRRDEPPHVHHDLQYLFIADPATPLALLLL